MQGRLAAAMLEFLSRYARLSVQPGQPQAVISIAGHRPA
jgi:hypothetical protein